MLVIGLGRFGRHLSVKLTDLGNEVMAVDKDEPRVTRVANIVTASQICDCQDEETLKTLGVKNYDICFVCIGDFQASLEITSMLKDLGAKYIVSKTDREKQAKFLMKIGADYVVHSEKDMAQRIAVKYSANNVFDYIELNRDYGIFEIQPPEDWIGRTISDINVRSKYNVNVIASKMGDKIVPMLNAEHIFTENEHLIIAGSQKDSLKLMK